MLINCCLDLFPLNLLISYINLNIKLINQGWVKFFFLFTKILIKNNNIKFIKSKRKLLILDFLFEKVSLYFVINFCNIFHK